MSLYTSTHRVVIKIQATPLNRTVAGHKTLAPYELLCMGIHGARPPMGFQSTEGPPFKIHGTRVPTAFACCASRAPPSASLLWNGKFVFPIRTTCLSVDGLRNETGKLA